MNPMYDAEELARSLRWAVASASADPSPNMGMPASQVRPGGPHLGAGRPGKAWRHDGYPGGTRAYHAGEGLPLPAPRRVERGGPTLPPVRSSWWTLSSYTTRPAGWLTALADPGRPPGALARRELWDKGGVSGAPALAAGQGPRVGSRAPAGCSLLKRWPPGFKGVPRRRPPAPWTPSRVAAPCGG